MIVIIAKYKLLITKEDKERLKGSDTQPNLQ